MYQRIRDLREDLDLSQKDIADVLNVTQTTYSKYERGVHEIPIELLIKLALFHKTSVDYLLGLTDVKAPYERKRRQ